MHLQQRIVQQRWEHQSENVFVSEQLLLEMPISGIPHQVLVCTYHYYHRIFAIPDDSSAIHSH